MGTLPLDKSLRLRDRVVGPPPAEQNKDRRTVGCLGAEQRRVRPASFEVAARADRVEIDGRRTNRTPTPHTHDRTERPARASGATPIISVMSTRCHATDISSGNRQDYGGRNKRVPGVSTVGCPDPDCSGTAGGPIINCRCWRRNRSHAPFDQDKEPNTPLCVQRARTRVRAVDHPDISLVRSAQRSGTCHGGDRSVPRCSGRRRALGPAGAREPRCHGRRRGRRDFRCRHRGRPQAVSIAARPARFRRGRYGHRTRTRPQLESRARALTGCSQRRRAPAPAAADRCRYRRLRWRRRHLRPGYGRCCQAVPVRPWLLADRCRRLVDGSRAGRGHTVTADPGGRRTEGGGFGGGFVHGVRPERPSAGIEQRRTRRPENRFARHRRPGTPAVDHGLGLHRCRRCRWHLRRAHVECPSLIPERQRPRRHRCCR